MEISAAPAQGLALRQQQRLPQVDLDRHRRGSVEHLQQVSEHQHQIALAQAALEAHLAQRQAASVEVLEEHQQQLQQQQAVRKSFPTNRNPYYKDQLL